MRSIADHEIDLISVDYIYFKQIAEKYKTKKVQYAFRTFQNDCIKKLEKLVLSRIYKYKKFSNYLDLKQDAFMAILSAFDSFDPLKGGKFSWWVKQYIKTNVSRAANAHSTIRFPINKAKENIPFKVTEMPVLIDCAISPLQAVEILDCAKHINNAMEKLSHEHQDVLNMTFGCNDTKPHSVNDILKAMHISRSRYSKLLREAKLIIREHFKKLEKM